MKPRRAPHTIALFMATLGLPIACDRPGTPAPIPSPTAPDVRPATTPPPALTLRMEPAAPGSAAMVGSHDFGDRLVLPDSRISEPFRAGAIVLVTPQAVIFAGREVAAIEDGVIAPRDVENHRITRLGEALAAAPGPEPARNLIACLDRRVKTEALFDVLYTAGRAGFYHYQLAVHPVGAAEANLVTALAISPRTNEAHGFDRLLGLELDPVSLRVGELFPGDDPFTHRPKWLRTLPWPGEPGTQADLTGLIRQIAGNIQGPADRYRPVLTLVLPGVLVSSLVAAREAAAGDECDLDAIGRDDRARCLFMRWQVASATSPLTEQPPEAKSATESLDRDTVRRVVRLHISDVSDCYNRGLTRKPGLRGRVEVEFTIAPTGAVQQAKLIADILEDPGIGRCITEAANHWTFPKSTGVTVVRYPFELDPS